MKVKRMRLAARVIGFSMVGFGGTMLVAEAVTESLQKGWAAVAEAAPPAAGGLLVIIGAFALAGCIVSFRRESCWHNAGFSICGIWCPHSQLCWQKSFACLDNVGCALSH